MKEGMQDTDWHRASMARFYQTGLRELLRGKIGAEGYEYVESRTQGIDISFGMDCSRGLFQVLYRNLPLPDTDGVFSLGKRRLVVVPVAESEDLENGRILCAGEQLLDFLSERVGGGPASADWDEDMVRCLAPLDRLIPAFLETTGQDLDETNLYSRITHLRRLLMPHGRGILPDSHLGRVCPVDMPENPDFLGKVLTICRGARVEAERIVIRSRDPADRLGPVAAMIPFIHHTDPIRAQIAVIKMRQWRAAAGAEPSLVRTGLEPEDPQAWLGCDLLTAFTSHGKDTYEDSLLLSRSAAARLGFDAETAVGTLLSNRNGQKGVVGKILPDERMPKLRDGTPVELMVSFIGLHKRMNTGQLLEAAAGWIARKTGKPFLARPFAEGDLERIKRDLSGTPHRQRLRMDGQQDAEGETLTGWVYWGVCTFHASNRLKADGIIGLGTHMRQGEMENHVLIRRGAYRTIQERFTVLAAEETKEPGWSALYGNLKRKLAAAGIRAGMGDDGLTFRLAEPEGDAMPLAVPLEHPWLPGHAIRSVGMFPETGDFRELEKTNRSLTENRDLPASLRESRVERLQSLLDAYFRGLLTQMDLRMGNRVLRSGRGMIAVGAELAIDQVGIPGRMAEALFDGAVPGWVVLNRAPTMEATAVVAFHPVIVEGDAIRLNPYVCRWMNADYDGDQVAVLVPGSEETQEEAGRILSVRGHVGADPGALDTLTPNQEALWGLAKLWLSPEGRRRILATLPALRKEDDLLTRLSLRMGLRRVLEADGAEEAIGKTVALWDLGFSAAERSGATLDPFAMAEFHWPAAPTGSDREDWERHIEQCIQILAVRRDYDDPAMGGQLLAVHCGARGEERSLLILTAGYGLLEDRSGRRRVTASGFLSGMDYDGYAAHARVYHERMAENAALWNESRHPGVPDYRPYRPEGRHVIARAMRSRYPGIVFARAAAAGETDPLSEIDTRLFVGLLPLE